MHQSAEPFAATEPIEREDFARALFRVWWRRGERRDGEEARARVASFRSPTRSRGIQTPLEKLIDKRRKDETTLPQLEADLSRCASWSRRKPRSAIGTCEQQ